VRGHIARILTATAAATTASSTAAATAAFTSFTALRASFRRLLRRAGSLAARGLLLLLLLRIARRLRLPCRRVLPLLLRSTVVTRLAILTLAVAPGFLRRSVAMLVPTTIAIAVAIPGVTGGAIAVAHVTRLLPAPLRFVPRALDRACLRRRFGGLARAAEKEAP
jgi:hypothetical protein